MVAFLELFANNAHGTIASPGLLVGATSLVLDSGQGSAFPSPQSGEFFRFEIENVGLTTFEACYCTGLSGDTFTTIARAQDGTAASAFATGSRVRLRPTAAMLRAVLGSVARESPQPFAGWAGPGGNALQYWGTRYFQQGTTTVASTISNASLQDSIPGLIHSASGPTVFVGSYGGLNNERVWRGNGTNRGGFDIWLGFALPTNLASTFAFVGLDGDNNVYLTTNSPGLRTTTAQMGFGFDASSGTGTNWRLFHSSGSSGSVTSLDTGMQRNQTDAYLAHFYALPNAGSVQATLYNAADGSSYDHTISTNMPASTAFLVSRNIAFGAAGLVMKTYGAWRFPVNQSEPTS